MRSRTAPESCTSLPACAERAAASSSCIRERALIECQNDAGAIGVRQRTAATASWKETSVVAGCSNVAIHGRIRAETRRLTPLSSRRAANAATVSGSPPVYGSASGGAGEAVIAGRPVDRVVTSTYCD